MRIKKLNDVDEIALKLLADCGNASTDSLRNVGLSQTRLENYKRDGLIRPISCDCKYAHKDKDTAWGVTDKGREFIKENYGLATTSSIVAVRHNTKVSELYAEVIGNGGDINRIYGEKETRILVEEKLELLKATDYNRYLEWNDRYEHKELSMPDFSYVSEDGTIECYEVTTDNYGKEELDAKSLTITLLDANYYVTKI